MRHRAQKRLQVSLRLRVCLGRRMRLICVRAVAHKQRSCVKRGCFWAEKWDKRRFSSAKSAVQGAWERSRG